MADPRCSALASAMKSKGEYLPTLKIIFTIKHISRIKGMTYAQLASKLGTDEKHVTESELSHLQPLLIDVLIRSAQSAREAPGPRMTNSISSQAL